MFEAQLKHVGVIVGDKEVERRIYTRRVRYLTPIARERLAAFDLHAPIREDLATDAAEQRDRACPRSADAAAVRPYPCRRSFWPRSGPVSGFPVRAPMRAAIGARRHAAAVLSGSPRAPRESKRPGNSPSQEGRGPRGRFFPPEAHTQCRKLGDFGGVRA